MPPEYVQRLFRKMSGRDNDQPLTPELWEQRWGAKEACAKDAFHHCIAVALKMKIQSAGNTSHEEAQQFKRLLANDSKKIDTDTGLQNRILLARANEALRNGKLVLTTTSRLGAKMDPVTHFATGGLLEFNCCYDGPTTGTREKSGRFFGIVLNVDYDQLRGNHEPSMILSTPQIMQSVNALISAYKMHSLRDQLQLREEFHPLSPDEFHQTINELLFGTPETQE